MILFYTDNIDLASQTIILEDSEWQHCHKVLRKQEGDEVSVMDGKGKLYKAKIENAAKKQGILSIVDIEKYTEKGIGNCIAICPTKNMTRIEWMIEKAVEVGTANILLFHSHRTERTKVNMDRVKKIILSAAKQSLNLWLPELHYVTKFSEAINFSKRFDNRFIAHCYNDNPHLFKLCSPVKSNIVFIGPEGDFTLDEIKDAEANDIKSVGLGQSRLRTETAGFVAAHIFNLSYEINTK
jgi:16S rRNA (uracil1498-N3)-methyltransferase